MSETAHSDNKIAFTSQTYDVEYNYKYKKVSYEACYAEASRILRDIKRYEPWSGAGLGPSLGGWESQEKIMTRLNILIATIVKEYPQVVAVPYIKKTVAAPLTATITADPADCKERAYAMFGPYVGRVPGAQVVACHYGKIAIVGGLLGALVVMGILSPYANLLSKAIGKKKNKRSK